MPAWLKKRPAWHKTQDELSNYLITNSIETVCTNARCPNITECYSKANVSFLILGSICTRNCPFCAIENGKPRSIKSGEPVAIAEAAYRFRLRYAVITSVTRDDIGDGGSGHYREVVRAVKGLSPSTLVETLTPDFRGSKDAIDKIISAGADVFSHNMETVGRLYPRVRPDFEYSRSLGVLSYASSRKKAIVKSGFMVGLGERRVEITQLMSDIKSAGCSVLTIGQYLKPKGSTLKVDSYIPPEIFEELKEEAFGLGFKTVASGPFVRSSYKAGELLAHYDKGNQ